MPKPKTSPELSRQAAESFGKLTELVDSLDSTVAAVEFPPGTLNRNVRDVLMHLYHWHLLLLNWYEVGMSGGRPEMPSPGYTWKTVPALNIEIQKMYQHISMIDALAKVKQSHQQVFELIGAHPEEALFEKRRFAWTGSTSLAAYLISNTSSHYNWAIKFLKKNLKAAGVQL